jgi:hypothetical protein
VQFKFAVNPIRNSPSLADRVQSAAVPVHLCSSTTPFVHPFIQGLPFFPIVTLMANILLVSSPLRALPPVIGLDGRHVTRQDPKTR